LEARAAGRRQLRGVGGGWLSNSGEGTGHGALWATVAGGAADKAGDGIATLAHGMAW
jgi:hypothetical protein